MTTADVAEAFDAGGWKFSPEVVAEFDNHVRQSVPFYDVIQDAVAELSDWLAPDGSKLVDLGISTGETFRRIVLRHKTRNFDLIGYDESEEMLEAAISKVGRSRLTCYPRRVEDGLYHRDADLTIALFLLQFLSPTGRLIALENARAASAKTGAILVAEKVRTGDSRWHEIATEVSWDRKADAGISSDAIRAKARALRGVLRPMTEKENHDLLRDAGWVGVSTVFRWHQWCLFGGFAS